MTFAQRKLFAATIVVVYLTFYTRESVARKPLTELMSFKQRDDHVHRTLFVALSPNGDLLATATSSGRTEKKAICELWRADSQELAVRHTFACEFPGKPVFNSDATHLAFLADIRDVFRWTLAESNKPPRLLQRVNENELIAGVYNSPQGLSAVVARKGDDVLRNLEMWSSSIEFPEKYDLLWCPKSFSPTERTVAMGPSDGPGSKKNDCRVVIYSYASMAVDRELKHAGFGRPFRVGYSPKGDYLAAATVNYEVVVWEVESQAVVFEKRIKERKPDRIRRTHISSDNSMFAFTTSKRVIIWDIETGRIAFQDEFQGGVSLSFAANSTRVAISGLKKNGDRLVRVFKW